MMDIEQTWADVLNAPPHETLRDAVVLGLWSIHTYGNDLSRPISNTWSAVERERHIRLAARMVNNFELTYATDAAVEELEAVAKLHGIEAVEHRGTAGPSYTSIACKLIRTFRSKLHFASAKFRNVATMFDWTIDAATIDGEELAEILAKSPIDFDCEWLVTTVKNEFRRLKPVKPERSASAKDKRDKWIYEQLRDGLQTGKQVVEELARIATLKDWTPIASPQGVFQAANRWAKRKNKPQLPTRKDSTI
jgi:hypothetical protein